MNKEVKKKKKKRHRHIDCITKELGNFSREIRQWYMLACPKNRMFRKVFCEKIHLNLDPKNGK